MKHSRQREYIRKNLAGRRDHPTAEMVFADMQSEFPKISLATVYRNLGLLSDLGEIRRLVFPDGPDRYDGNLVPHDHFVCRSCGAIIDLERTEPEKKMLRQAAGNFPGQIEDYSIHFRGLCPACAASSGALAEEICSS